MAKDDNYKDADSAQFDPSKTGYDKLQVVVRPKGIPEWVGVGGLILIGTLIAAYAAKDDNKCQLTNTTIQAQAAANKAQADQGTEVIRHDTTLRIKVVEECVAKGNIPTFSQGNVDCKPAPK